MNLPDRVEPGETSPHYPDFGPYFVVFYPLAAGEQVPALTLPHLPNPNLLYFTIKHEPIKSEFIPGLKSGAFALQYSLQ